MFRNKLFRQFFRLQSQATTNPSLRTLPDEKTWFLVKGTHFAGFAAVLLGVTGLVQLRTELHLDTKFALVDTKFALVDTKIASVEKNLDTKFALVDTKFALVDTKIASLEKNLDTKFALVDTKFALVDTKLANVEKNLETKLEKNFAQVEALIRPLQEMQRIQEILLKNALRMSLKEGENQQQLSNEGSKGG